MAESPSLRDSGAWRRGHRCAWAWRPHSHRGCGAGRWQPTQATGYMLPARSVPCPPPRDEGGHGDGTVGGRGSRGRPAPRSPAGGRQAGNLRVVSPGSRCRGTSPGGICLVPPRREATSRLEGAASAGPPGLPRAAGHLSATLEPAESGWAAPDPRGSLRGPSTNLGPESFLSVCAL